MSKKMIIAVIALMAVAAIAIAVYASMPAKRPKPVQAVNDFQSCRDAGGMIAESYPEQCMIDGRSFANDSQAPVDKNEYLGLTEQEAATKAEAAKRAHRVVERDGQQLPVTMDFSQGRLNFYIKDGHVVRVDVEGID